VEKTVSFRLKKERKLVGCSFFRQHKMHLMYYIVDGKRVYTLKKSAPCGTATVSAHPGKKLTTSIFFSTPPPTPIAHSLVLLEARFSPDDKFSRQRVTLKKRFGILPTQLPPRTY